MPARRRPANAAPSCLKPRSIKWIAQQRMPDMRQMHPDLMRTPGFESARDHAGENGAAGIHLVENLVMRDG